MELEIFDKYSVILVHDSRDILVFRQPVHDCTVLTIAQIVSKPHVSQSYLYT